MKSYPLHRDSIVTHARSEMIDITARIERLLGEYEVADGMVLIFVPHTTAAVTINENADPDVRHDLLRKLEELVPKEESYYEHVEGNSDSHAKTSLVGNSVSLLVERGKLVLGQWQGVYLCEFDGPRQRQVYVKVIDWGPGK